METLAKDVLGGLRDQYSARIKEFRRDFGIIEESSNFNSVCNNLLQVIRSFC